MATPFRIAIVTSCLAMTGCATLDRDNAPDAICREIASFARAAADKSVHSVELVTDWPTWSKTCTHDNYGPGMTLCDWLLKHSSTEFMYANINDALACLGPGNPSDLVPRLIPNYASGSYSSFEAKHLGLDYEVQVEFSTGVTGKPESLKISAERQESL
ncbi:hypothetical protein [Arenimonas oryziterrae]|uniref:Lipoprotein n=1 Tax=Arenimonas oryziterrae DSM 21050 = YC6267 TaxID=1121015 RepID=A0A091AQQ1_9GAMM|nr:hypothetical protein [Arenimonas oryziterrae]KFN41344.1 hypothetical protein N789_05575 [Arenimonas oryziterrae DSM 21050 = YC6267]